MRVSRINNLYPIIILLAGTLLFWKVGSYNISEWDEARNGVIAYNMLQNGDLINYYYSDGLDTWTNKPPLMIWLIAASYKLLGYNEFALRLPSVLSSLLLFIVLYRFIKLYTNNTKALITCLVLMSCSAIIGWHAGRSGDYDALLALMLLCSAYYYFQYLTHRKIYTIYLCAIFTGMAFYTKGTAGFLFLPGMVLFTFISGNARSVFKSVHTYLASAIFVAIVSSWIALVGIYGKTVEDSYYGTNNSIEALFLHDTYKRLTDENFNVSIAPDKLVFVHTIDAKMNLWNYIFYLSILIGAIYVYKHRHGRSAIYHRIKGGLISYFICITLPIIIVFSLSAHIYSWYFVPIWGFIAYFIAEGIFALKKLHKSYYFGFILLFAFTYTRHLLYLNSTPCDMHGFLTKRNKNLEKSERIIIVSPPKQDLVLYLTWLDLPFERVLNSDELSKHKNATVVVHNSANSEDMAQKIKPIQYAKEYYIGYVK